MNRIGKISLFVVLVLVLGVGTVIGMNLNQPAVAQAKAGGAGSHTVVSTDGTNLIVTDNKTNTLYYYSIDKDAEIGSDLKLRGSVDLTQVGKDIITPKVSFKKK